MVSVIFTKRLSWSLANAGKFGAGAGKLGAAAAPETGAEVLVPERMGLAPANGVLHVAVCVFFLVGEVAPPPDLLAAVCAFFFVGEVASSADSLVAVCTFLLVEERCSFTGRISASLSFLLGLRRFSIAGFVLLNLYHLSFIYLLRISSWMFLVVMPAEIRPTGVQTPWTQRALKSKSSIPM